MPQGATVHFVVPGIDTGDIIVSRHIPVYRHDTCESINNHVAILAGELMTEAVTSIANGEAPRTPKDPNVGETFKVIPDDLLRRR